MAELIEQYLEQFHENFPLFTLMGVEEAEVEAIIQDCLDKGTPYRPQIQNGDGMKKTTTGQRPGWSDHQ